MTIPPELEAKILRYYHIEKWRIGTLSAQLDVHHSTVSRVLAQAGLPRIDTPRRASTIDAYLPFILETLEKFPTLTVTRLHCMVKERSYVQRGSFPPFYCLTSPQTQSRSLPEITDFTQRAIPSRLGVSAPLKSVMHTEG
jgi:hypothetical protein